MLAKEIMNTKVIILQENDTIEEIAEILVKNNISGAPVVNHDGEIVGIVTEEDLLHQETNPRTPGFLNILGAFIYINGIERYREDFKKLAATKAQEIMTTEVITVNADTDIKRVATLMVENDINRVPVVENKKIIGIISRADIVKTLAHKA
ncbi:MAG: CBS domain-containing protein [Desulfotomaculaceae bacterium]|nr:CBS domain-containing protein [Desulfotomaculaceae bacterium]